MENKMYMIEKSVNMMLRMQNLQYREFSNLILSPFSLEILSFSILPGVAGKCLEELSNCLFGRSVTIAEVTESIRYFKLIINHINALDKVDFKMNNFIYVSDRYQLNQNYIDFVYTNLSTHVKQLNFADENLELYNIIDQDIRNATLGRTDKVLKCVPTVSRLLLVNCISFQGELRTRPSAQYDGIFNANNDERIVRYTVQQGNFKFSEANPDFVYVEMPYKNETMNLCVLFPRPGVTLRKVLKGLNFQTIMQLLKASTAMQVEVHLPDVKLQANLDLAYVLQLCGICKVFEEDNADFSKMSAKSKGLYLESVITNSDLFLQDLTQISCSIAMMQAAPAPAIKPSIVIDRPFMYFVNCDMNQQTVILFSGVVNVYEC